MELNPGMESICGRMGGNMKEALKMGFLTEMALTGGLMEWYIQGLGKREPSMVFYC